MICESSMFYVNSESAIAAAVTVALHKMGVYSNTNM